MDRRKENQKNSELIFLFLILIALSCAYNYKKLTYDYDRNEDLTSILEKIELLRKEVFLKNYLKGIFFFENGFYDSSFIYLENADKYRRERFNVNTIKNVEKTLLNTTASPYFGEDYEDIMINYYKSIIFALNENYESAAVESRIISQKLKLFSTIYKEIDEKNNFNYSHPFADLISGIFYLLSNEYQDAYISLYRADSVYNNYSERIEKPLNLAKLVNELSMYLDEGKNFDSDKLKIIVYQKGEVSRKREHTSYITLPVKNRIYMMKISYPYMNKKRTYKRIFHLSNGEANQRIYVYPSLNLSLSAYEMLEEKKHIIMNTSVLQAGIKVGIAIGSEIAAKKITEKIIEKQNDKDKAKTSPLPEIIGCLTGFTVNQYLNSLTKADTRQVFMLPDNVYIFILYDEKDYDNIIIDNREYKIDKKFNYIKAYSNKFR